MENKDALEFAKKEREAYKRKVKDGFIFYQRIVEYYDIVIEAIDKTTDELCARCAYKNKCAIFDNFNINYCSDWREEE